MDIATLIASGYARTSNRHGMVSRIDRPDWREHMASTHPSGMNWVNGLGDRNAADYYRRCLSKDTLDGFSRDEVRKFPASHDGPSEFMELKSQPVPKPHIFWTYYPRMKRGFWRVSPKPRPYHRHTKAWDAAHKFKERLNAKVRKSGQASQYKTAKGVEFIDSYSGPTPVELFNEGRYAECLHSCVFVLYKLNDASRALASMEDDCFLHELAHLVSGVPICTHSPIENIGKEIEQLWTDYLFANQIGL